MHWTDLVALLSLLQYFAFMVLVGRARGRYGVKAPAVSGNEFFERYFRVQMNTLELMLIFLPALYLAAVYWSPHWAAAVGAIYLVGRLIYLQSYVKDPASRGLGYALSAGPALVLLGGALVGLVMTARH
jgi:uncharacterized MAPEG superfamily protein